MYDFEDLLGRVAAVGVIVLLIWVIWYSNKLVENCEIIGGSYAAKAQLCAVNGEIYTNQQVRQMRRK